jgi:hypothetical protein
MINNLNLEIYEFEIKNYPWQLAVNSKSILPGIDIKTSELISTGKNCGSINTEIDLTKHTHSIFKNVKTHTTRTCDPIEGKMTVSNTTDKVNLVAEDELMDSFRISGYKINSRDLINFSNKFGAKNTALDYNNPNGKKYAKDEYINLIKTEFPSMAILYTEFDRIITQVKNILEPEWGFMVGNTQTHTLIKKIIPKKEDKFVIIGDLHGSYHTFIRILLRLVKMKIMNNKGYLINNYNLIFLGDIVDRGQYGYEIMMLLFVLKSLNHVNSKPDKGYIYLNRGNHEESLSNSSEGFIQELQAKFTLVEGTQMHTKLNNIFEKFNSAIIIKNPYHNKYTYLSHGGLPTYLYSRFPIDPLNPNEPIDVNGEAQLYPFYKDENYVNFDKPGNIFIADNLIKLLYTDVDNNQLQSANTIRWNDYWGYKNSRYNEYRGSFKLGENAINEIKENNVELIIRGHQDSLYNTKTIFKLNRTNWLDLNDTFNDINDIAPFGILKSNIGEEYNCYNFNYLININEYTGNLRINNRDGQLLPVVIVSTNTDKGRDLAKDSFAILKYDLQINEAYDNCVVSGSAAETGVQELRRQKLEELRREQEELRRQQEERALAKRQRINQKYLKYKQKYLKLKELLYKNL